MQLIKNSTEDVSLLRRFLAVGACHGTVDKLQFNLKAHSARRKRQNAAGESSSTASRCKVDARLCREANRLRRDDRQKLFAVGAEDTSQRD